MSFEAKLIFGGGYLLWHGKEKPAKRCFTADRCEAAGGYLPELANEPATVPPSGRGQSPPPGFNSSCPASSSFSRLFQLFQLLQPLLASPAALPFSYYLSSPATPATPPSQATPGCHSWPMNQWIEGAKASTRVQL